MLSLMRRHSKSKLIKILLLGVALSFVVGFGAFAYVSRSMEKTGGDLNIWVAKVNGTPIDLQTTLQTIRYLERRYEDMLGDNAKQLLQQLDLPSLAINQLISDRIVEIVATDMGLVVTDTELADTIYRMPAFQVNNRFDREQYMRVLHRHNLTPDEFETEHRRELLSQKLRQLVATTTKVTDTDLYENFLNKEEKINLRFVKLLPEQIEEQIDVSDAEVAAHFEANKSKFRVPEKRKVNYIELRLDDFADEITITDAEIENYYQENMDRFQRKEEVQARHILIKAEQNESAEVRAAARIKAENLLQQIRSGADFGALASLNSEDPGSKTRGGSLGWFSRGKMVGPFENAAFEMEPGEVSGIVETQYGYHIIEVLDRHDEGITPLENVHDGIEQQLLKERGMEEAQKKATELAGLITPEDDLLTFGSDRGLRVGSSSTFFANGAVPGLQNGMQATRLAFAMEKQEISDPIVAETAVYILQLTHIIEEHDPPMAEVEAEVREDLQKSRAAALLKEKAQQVIQAVQAGATLEEAGKKFNLDVQETGSFARGAGSVPKIGMVPELVVAAFAAGETGSLLPKTYASGNGVVVCQVIDHIKPGQAEFAAKKEELAEALIQRKAQLTLQAWIEQAQKKVKIVRNEEAIQTLRKHFKPGESS